MGKHDYNLKMDHALQKASPEKIAKAKEKAVKGGMPQKVADKVFKMGSKGVFEMQPGNNNKPISELNMSHKDELMMKALYTHGPDGKPHKDPDPKPLGGDLEGYTGSAAKPPSIPSSQQIKDFNESTKPAIIQNKADFIDRLKNQKTSDSIQTIMSQGESAAKQIYNFDIFADKTAGPESGAALGKKENFIGEDPITSQDDYYTKQRKKKTEEFNKQIFDFDKKRLQMKPLKMSYGMKNNK
tara:strand:- start:1715 stop:2437 length:723 start_codon:yes stop_codon:yes gene_type:complete